MCEQNAGYCCRKCIFVGMLGSISEALCLLSAYLPCCFTIVIPPASGVLHLMICMPAKCSFIKGGNDGARARSREGGAGCAKLALDADTACARGTSAINLLLDQGSSTFKFVQRTKEGLSRECYPSLDMCSPPNFANGLQAANSASRFRCLAPMSLNPCLILASCKVKMQIIRIQLIITKYQGGGKNALQTDVQLR